MTKKILLCLFLAVALSFILVSCGEVGNDQATDTKTAETESVEPDTAPADTDTEAPSADGTEDPHPEEEPREIHVSIRFDGKNYVQVRKSVWPCEFDESISFRYLGEIGEELENGGVIEGKCIPKDTPVYISEDGSFVRVASDGIVYYCRNHVEEPAPPETNEDGNVVTEAPGSQYLKWSVIVYNGNRYRSDISYDGKVWEFELDENWRFVGLIRSEVTNREYPEYELEANFDCLGNPLYYNENLDIIAILFEDDNYAYSDIDWEIWTRCVDAETE